jgi:amidohydrolase family protein
VIPEGARILNVTGTTILPGYVDLHDHMLLPKGVHPGQSWQSLAKLAYGVTAARDPNSAGNDVFAYRERERSGTLLGPRVFSTGTAYYGSDRPIRTPDDAADVVRPYADYFGSETFKLYPVAVSRSERQLLAMALRERGLNATVHTELELAITATIDGFSGIEHSHTIQIHEDVAGLFGRSGTTYTQTYGADISGVWQYLFLRYGQLWNEAKMRRFIPPSAHESVFLFPSGPPEWANLRRIVSGSASIAMKGGRVGVGSHGNIPGLGLHYEMWLYALGGMAAHDVLRSATAVGAAAIGHAGDFGSLDVGKLADLQVLDENPLVDIHNSTSIRYVMKNGRLYRGDDLSEIWPDHRPLGCIYVWETPCSRNATARTRTSGAGRIEGALQKPAGARVAEGQAGPAPRLWAQ